MALARKCANSWDGELNMLDETRRNGAIKLAVGGLLFAILFVMILNRGDFLGLRGGTYVTIGLGAPGALGLIGAIEILFGTPFAGLSTKWDSLSGSQRGLFGISIILAAAILIFGTLLLAGWLTHPEPNQLNNQDLTSE